MLETSPSPAVGVQRSSRKVGLDYSSSSATAHFTFQSIFSISTFTFRLRLVMTSSYPLVGSSLGLYMVGYGLKLKGIAAGLAFEGEDVYWLAPCFLKNCGVSVMVELLVLELIKIWRRTAYVSLSFYTIRYYCVGSISCGFSAGSSSIFLSSMRGSVIAFFLSFSVSIVVISWS